MRAGHNLLLAIKASNTNQDLSIPSTKRNTRDCVYVIGAGFSAGLGYPLTSDLLFRLWEQLDDDLRERLSRVIKFHHTGFSEKLFTTFPNVEELLSEILINEKLFDASREFVGEFKLSELQELQRDLLLRIGHWFHDLSEKSAKTGPNISSFLHDKTRWYWDGTLH